MPGGGSGMTLFSKLIRTKDLRTVQGEDPRSTKPKLTVRKKTKQRMHISYFMENQIRPRLANSINTYC